MAAHDGTLVLISNVPDFQPEDLVVRYKSLADIERGFRLLERELDIAPVYHRKPERLRAHAFVCFFALLMHRIMRMSLRAARSDTSVERGLTKMSKTQLQLFEHLDVRKPAAGTV